MAYRFVNEEPIQTQAEKNPQFLQSPQEGQRYRFVDEKAENIPQNKTFNPFATPEITPEQYKNMSLWEKKQYAEDLEKEQRYEHSKALTKNIPSGLTFGATENIEALRPEEGEEPIGTVGGQIIGSALPIGGISKLVGGAFKGVSKAIQHAPKILQYLNRFAQGFSTGSLYESGKQGVNAASGKEVDLSQIPITGALFGAGETLIQAFGNVGRKFMQLSPKHQAQILEQGIIPSDLPKSQYETAEEMLGLINEKKASNFPDFPPGEPPPPPGASPGLKGRVSSQGEDLGLRPVPHETNPNLADKVGNIFSRNTFKNTTEGGHAYGNELRAIDQNVYRGVNENYRISRELNGKVDEIHPNLVGRLKSTISELESIPELSDIQKRKLRAAQNIIKRFATFDENGQITGYLPVNNQVLIDQVQSLRQIIDYDFEHGNAKNIFRPLINDIQESALNAARSSGTPEAADAIINARNSYRMWVEAFDNDYVRPFRDNSNQDYSKLFKSALDFDEHNMLKRILNTTPRGQELINASTREIVEKNLGKFFENPKNVNPREFDKALRELEAVITPEQVQQTREAFREASRRPVFRAIQQVRQPTTQESIASKYVDKKPEDVQKMMNSRSGIKELKKDLSGTEQKRELFETLSKQKMRSILREGNIEKDFTGNDLYKFLNKESNYEIFSEILGESETESLRQSAKEIGKEQVKSEVRKKAASEIGKNLVSYKILKTLLLIL